MLRRSSVTWFSSPSEYATPSSAIPVEYCALSVAERRQLAGRQTIIGLHVAHGVADAVLQRVKLDTAFTHHDRRAELPSSQLLKEFAVLAAHTEAILSHAT